MLSHVSVQRPWSMLSEPEFKVTPVVAHPIKQKLSRAMCSQIDEDACNRQKNFKKRG